MPNRYDGNAEPFSDRTAKAIRPPRNLPVRVRRLRLTQVAPHEGAQPYSVKPGQNTRPPGYARLRLFVPTFAVGLPAQTDALSATIIIRAW